MIPQKIGRYQVRASLIDGDSPTLFRAYDPNLAREVALKVLPLQLLHHTTYLEQFRKDALRIASLEHHGIVPLYDFGVDSGQPFIVMRLMRGGSLAEKLQRGALSLAEASDVLFRLASVIDLLHQREGMAGYSVLTPSAILFDEYDVAHLAGLAIDTSRQAGLIEPPRYMSVEELNGQPLNQRSDVYRLGIILFEMLTAHSPFAAPTPAAVMKKHFIDPVPDILRLNPQLPADCQAIIEQALAKEPSERYTTARELSDAFQRLVVRASALHAMTPSSAPPIVPSHTPPIIPSLPIAKEAAPTVKEAPTIAKEARPTVKEAPPTVQKAPPRVQSARPIAQKTRPIAKEAPPIAKEARPIPQKAPPRVQSARPIAKEAPPIAKEAPPTVQKTPPRVQSARPIAQKTRPIAKEAPPIVKEASPIAEEDAQAKMEAKPRRRWQIKRWLGATVLVALLALLAWFAVDDLSYDVGSTFVSEKDGMTLVYVPEGEFLMGALPDDAEAEANEKPQRLVSLDAYWIDQTEVTNAMFARFVEETGHQTDAERDDWAYVYLDETWGQPDEVTWRHPTTPESTLDGLENYPVVQVSWHDANAYCKWAERRLPTEAEWEKAARGSDGRKYAWGNELPASAWQLDGIRGVASYANGISPYQAFDMTSNVWEWTADWYHEQYHQSTDSHNPKGTGGEEHTYRGGAFDNETSLIRATIRQRANPIFRVNLLGFRCAQSP